MALFDQQQQDEEQQNQIQPYGVCVGSRRVRTVQRVPYVPDMNIGRPLFRARQHHAYPVREQQHVMLQDRIDQDDQHNIRQDNIAYNRRLYNDPQVRAFSCIEQKRGTNCGHSQFVSLVLRVALTLLILHMAMFVLKVVRLRDTLSHDSFAARKQQVEMTRETPNLVLRRVFGVSQALLGEDSNHKIFPRHWN